MELKVLFVDDEINILNALQREIQDCGFNSFFASSAKEALDMLQSNDISLVVTDLHMPSVNGIELLKQIRNDYPEIIRIVLTGYADKDMVIDAINQGQVFYYIMKPCDLDELKIIVNKGLEYFRTQKERKELYSILFEEKSKIENLNQSLNKSLIEQANTIVYQKNKIEDAYNKLNELS
ncbi:MAG TPA: response regulator, partial [bacterium]|nr:response regulator [bacterium]